MSTYAIANLKGGVGKTTTAIHLAACAAGRSLPVTVVDCDTEGSATRWASHAGELGFDVVANERNGLARQVGALTKGKRQAVFLDAPPNDREILIRAATIADVCVVSVTPTGLDVDRLMPTLELLRDVEASRRGLAVVILLTRWSGYQVLAREAVEALKGFPVLKARIRQLARYAQAFGALPRYLDEYRVAWRELRS